MLDTILDHRIVDRNGLSTDDVISLGDAGRYLEIISVTLHDETICRPITSRLFRGHVPGVVGIDQTQLVDLVPFQLELVNIFMGAVGISHVVYHRSMMGRNPVGPLPMHNVSRLDCDNLGSRRCFPMADDVSVLIGRRPDKSEITVVSGPAGSDFLCVIPSMRVIVLDAKMTEQEQGWVIWQRLLVSLINSVTQDDTMSGDLGDQGHCSQRQCFDRKHV